MQVELPPPAVDAESARRAVAEVLSRPEYDQLEPGLVERILAALAEGFGRLLSAFTGTAAGSFAGWVIIALLLALLALGIVRLARTLRPDPVAAGVATEGDVGRPPEEWLGAAVEHEAAGRWRDAVRCRYRALLAALAAGGRLDEVAGRTAGEYLSALRASVPAAGEPFAAATRTFERAWYGAEEVGPDDARAFAAAADDVLAAAGVAPARVGA